MDLKICPKGHNYDGDVNPTCPVCAAEKQGGIDRMASYGNAEDTLPPDTGYFSAPLFKNNGYETKYPTESVENDFAVPGDTEPITDGFRGGFDELGSTQPWENNNRAAGTIPPTKPPTKPFPDAGETMRYCDNSIPGVDNYNDRTMPYNPGMIAGFTPVVGWLVCTEGPDRGSDYRIRSGYNYIGRAEHMDICIRGDKQISREKHAIIAYDDTEKIFFFGPSDGRNIVRVNGKMVMVPTELNPYDIVKIGTSKLIFVPLCGDKFDWGA